MLSDVLALIGGLVLLVVGASVLVRGAAALALRLGVSPLVVGLTVVAFGTSAPELVVSVQAALAGAGGIAVGNVVGSNIANVGLILGIAVLVRPLATDPALVRRDLPVLIAVTLLTAGLLTDGRVGAGEGALLLVGLGLYLGWSAVAARREGAAAEVPVETSDGPAWRDALFLLGGFAALVVGSDLFVDGAVRLAEAAGVSNAVIGLTVVAIGTSLPELATSVVAAVRGESELAVGNVVGSNVFNLLGILGVASVVRPLEAPGLATPDLLVMTAFAVGLVGMLLTGRRLIRPEAAVLLLGYAVYVGYLASQAV